MLLLGCVLYQLWYLHIVTVVCPTFSIEVYTPPFAVVIAAIANKYLSRLYCSYLVPTTMSLWSEVSVAMSSFKNAIQPFLFL